MAFLLTPANINVFARRQGGKTPVKQGNNFGFDGDDQIEFEDADSTLHFFFPKDYAYAAADSVTDFSNRVSMRRYFYSDRGKDYMLVGVPWSWIDFAPAGDLIIDPTTNAATSDDVRLYDAGNYGSDTKLAVGKFQNTGNLKARTLISFNLTGIPSNAIVLNAQMKLKYYEAVNFGVGSWVDRWVQAHQMLVSWNEAQATKDNRLTGTAWNATYGKIGGAVPPPDDANGQYESKMWFIASDTLSLPMWKQWDLSALTQKWVNGAAANYGVILWADNEDVAGYTMRFYSSEATNQSDRPYLEVVYSTEATTKTVYFLKDHLGSIRATVLDSAAAPVIGYDDYDPWGYPLVLRMKAIPNAYLQGASKNKFTGMVFDDDYGLNLHHTPFRPYDGLMGRWVVMEPLANNNPGLSPYHYARNNPIGRIDPLGLDDFYYDDKGNLVERKKYSGWHNLWNADNYYVQGSDKAPNEHKGNKYWEIESAAVDKLIKGEVSGVVENFGPQILEFVQGNIAEGNFPFNEAEVLQKSPKGQAWDFKKELENKIYIFGGKGYLKDYIGNVAWGDDYG
jgi:RHS repeat-associated protein